MSTADWKRIEALFHECLVLSETERQALLAVEPPDVQSAVRKLIAADGSGERLAKVVQGAASLVTQPSENVGAYRLVREIGRGGMGSVYLAVRADAAFERRVAVKFVRSSVDSPQLRERFESERRILARLEHPYIARLLDAGATATDQPYLVMEYVEGETIIAYARSRNLSVRDRIVLFRKVCEAVHHAHQNLVVHRDLKPSNVMIDSSGTPKLLDFGIAKLLSGDPGVPTVQTLIRVWTPDYASPEQVRGDVVTTATDVYSLGAVLFELLAGQAPFREPGRTPGETERAVQQGLSKRPSDCNAELRRELRGDLDNIVSKAMRCEPAERYTSAAELSADLERVLNGQPVRARNYTVWERSGKFMARHRVAGLAASAALGSLFAGAVMTARSALRAEEARQQAVIERQRANAQRVEAIRQARLASLRETDATAQKGLADRRSREPAQVAAGLLEGVHGQERDLSGDPAARRRSLEATLRRLEELQRESPQDRDIARKLALRYEEMGVLLGDPAAPSDPEAGLRLLRQAAAGFESLHTAEPTRLSDAVELSTTYTHIAELLVYGARKPASGLDAANRAVYWGRTAQALAPRDTRAKDVLSYALLSRILLGVRQDLSHSSLNNPDHNSALPLAEKPAEQVTVLQGNDPNSLKNLMMSYCHAGRPGGNECYDRMSAITERLTHANPADLATQTELTNIIRTAGQYLEQGAAVAAGR